MASRKRSRLPAPLPPEILEAFKKWGSQGGRKRWKQAGHKRGAPVPKDVSEAAKRAVRARRARPVKRSGDQAQPGSPPAN